LLAERFISFMCHPTVTKISYASPPSLLHDALSIMKYFSRKP
jgi:hypothetical protein